MLMVTVAPARMGVNGLEAPPMGGAGSLAHAAPPRDGLYYGRIAEHGAGTP